MNDLDFLRTADAAWAALARDLHFPGPDGLIAVIERHRPRIEAAILGEPDLREFRELNFDEQRAYMARMRREWAADRMQEALG